MLHQALTQSGRVHTGCHTNINALVHRLSRHAHVRKLMGTTPREKFHESIFDFLLPNVKRRPLQVHSGVTKPAAETLNLQDEQFEAGSFVINDGFK